MPELLDAPPLFQGKESEAPAGADEAGFVAENAQELQEMVKGFRI